MVAVIFLTEGTKRRQPEVSFDITVLVATRDIIVNRSLRRFDTF